MGNSLVTQPISIDTDITSFRGDASVVSTNCTQGCGIRVTKLTLVAGASGSTAGVVTITSPSDGSALMNPLLVTAQSANTELYIENADVSGVWTWRDFAVTGLTATGTVLYLWYKV